MLFELYKNGKMYESVEGQTNANRNNLKQIPYRNFTQYHNFNSRITNFRIENVECKSINLTDFKRGGYKSVE